MVSVAAPHFHLTTLLGSCGPLVDKAVTVLGTLAPSLKTSGTTEGSVAKYSCEVVRTPISSSCEKERER